MHIRILGLWSSLIALGMARALKQPWRKQLLNRLRTRALPRPKPPQPEDIALMSGLCSEAITPKP